MTVAHNFKLTPIVNHFRGDTRGYSVRFDGRRTDLVLDYARIEAVHETDSGFLLWMTPDDRPNARHNRRARIRGIRDELIASPVDAIVRRSPGGRSVEDTAK